MAQPPLRATSELLAVTENPRLGVKKEGGDSRLLD